MSSDPWTAHLLLSEPIVPLVSHVSHMKLLKHHRLTLELGRTKTMNKNPVTEKAIRKLEDELVRIDPTGCHVTHLALALASASLNSRIRSRGLSAREMWFQRDQFTNQQIPTSDPLLIQSQHSLRKSNHYYSEHSKAPSGKVSPSNTFQVGDLVYLYCDRDKSHARNRYLVTAIEDTFCNLRKFVGSQLRNASYRVKKIGLLQGSFSGRTSPHCSY